MRTEITVAYFEELLPSLCNRETTLDSAGWTEENPLYGHCAVVSLIGQNLFGGELLRASLENTPFAHMRSHYWNRFPDNTEKDFTKPQFRDNAPTNLEAVVRERAYVLSNPESAKRYKLLAFNLVRAVDSKNSIDDPLYRACFENALDASCKKMKFGAIGVSGTLVIAQANNSTIAPLKELCEPECVRIGITSRTESMLGACAHAEESVLWSLSKKGMSMKDCEIYVTGVHPNGLPLERKAPEFTCLRCAVQMHHAEIKAVHVPFEGEWVSITPERAVKTALAYATKEKKI